MITANRAVELVVDPAIPSRDLLLDPQVVCERLSRASGVHVDRCQLRRAKYRIGESLRVVYDVTADGTTFVMSARTFDNAATVFDQARASATAVAAMPGVVHDPTTSSVWWTVPNDRRLTNLATLLDAPRRVHQAVDVTWDQSTLVEYAPERSATARLSDSAGEVVGYAKAYRDRDPLDLVDQYNGVADALAPVDGLRTPRAIGWARTDRIVVFEPMPGRSWRQLPISEQAPAMRRLGAAAAHIHDLPRCLVRQPFVRFRRDRLIRSAELVGIARPDVGDAARRLATRLVADTPAAGQTVCLHGDVHTNNMLFHNDEVHLIDFDQVGHGPAAADLCSMLASLMVLRLTDPGDVADRLGTALLDGYATIRPLPTSTDLRWHTAAALLSERAIRSVNRIYQPTLAVLPDVLTVAENVLAGTVALDD
jgi:hypothetical protein